MNKIHGFTLTISVCFDEQLAIYVPETNHMISKNSLIGLSNNGQANSQSQSSSETQSDQGSTISLVYPDGRVTSVKVRKRK